MMAKLALVFFATFAVLAFNHKDAAIYMWFIGAPIGVATTFFVHNRRQGGLN